MNMPVARIRTTAESALIARCVERLETLPGNAAVKDARGMAIDALSLSGLPTRRVESWHYTDLRTLLRALPVGGNTSSPAIVPLMNDASILLLNEGCAPAKQPYNGGAVSSIASMLDDGSIAGALAVHAPDDAIGQINAALVSDGFQLEIAAGENVSLPIEVQVFANAQSHTRLVINAGAKCMATIIERHVGGDAFVSALTHLIVGDGANISLIIDQERGNGAVHLGQLTATLGKDAKLSVFVMNAGGRLVRQEVHVSVKGEGSDFKLRGINLVGGDAHVDVTMTLAHEVAHTTSTEIIRNVITGRGHGVFQGQIKVFAGAQKTDAKMACNTLLLSDEGQFSTKPELEIFADDVQCGHGATVREVEAQHLFYLMARGIDQTAARGLLVKAFVAEIIEELENEALVEALETRLDVWLAAHA